MPAKAKSAPQAHVLFLVLFLAVFLLGGLGLVREGARAIHARAYVLSYTEELSWASELGRGSAGVEQNQAAFAGRDAVVFGVGFSATGAMFLIWSARLPMKPAFLAAQSARSTSPTIFRLSRCRAKSPSGCAAP